LRRYNEECERRGVMLQRVEKDGKTGAVIEVRRCRLTPC
jgi:hypothetical protein